MNSNTVNKFILWSALVLIVVLLIGCATGSKDGNDGKVPEKSVLPWTKEHPMKLLLVRATANDSAGIIDELSVDQALRRVCDSIPATHYLTLNYRDSLTRNTTDSGSKGVALADLGKKLGLDGAIVVRIARFGGVLAADVRILEPASGKVLFNHIGFSIIRYRDTTGTLYLGPALYDVLRKSIATYFHLPHIPSAPVAEVSMLISNVEIPNDPALGEIRTQREKISRTSIFAIGDYAILHFPEIIAFDYSGRNAVYHLAGIGAVTDYQPIDLLERKAMVAVGIDRYVVGSVQNVSSDSVRLRLELRSAISPSRDTLIDAQQQTYPKEQFQTARLENDFVVEMINLAEPLFEREAKRLRIEYEKK